MPYDFDANFEVPMEFIIPMKQLVSTKFKKRSFLCDANGFVHCYCEEACTPGESAGIGCWFGSYSRQYVIIICFTLECI